MTGFPLTSKPEHTPWGYPDTAEQVLPGIWTVSTPSHGGFILSAERQAAMPAALRLAEPFYEEDVDWSLVILGFVAEFRRLPTAGAQLRVEHARASVLAWHPDRWAAFTGETVPVAASPVLRRRAAYEAAIGDYVSTAAYGDWADWVPKGMVGVVGRRVEGVDASGFARYAGDPIYGLVDQVRYAVRKEVETFASLGAVRVESDAPITKQVLG